MYVMDFFRVNMLVLNTTNIELVCSSSYRNHPFSKLHLIYFRDTGISNVLSKSF
jgi:hypothetical protein